MAVSGLTRALLRSPAIPGRPAALLTRLPPIVQGAEFVFSGALSPVSPNMYPMLALLLLAGGLTATSLFFV